MSNRERGTNVTAVQYTDPTRVTDVRADATAPRNPYANGYGAKIPTSGWVRYGTRWHRVYVMCWSNQGTAYILTGGQRLVVDDATQERIKNAA